MAIGGARRYEDDRDAPGALVAAHQFGQFETVETRHLNVNERQCNVVLEQKFECLIARPLLQGEKVFPRLSTRRNGAGFIIVSNLLQILRDDSPAAQHRPRR
ncbi:hypothetical protein ASD31_00025 [Rhizobium sp. Root482]|nr:hypothetical protein ASD31_00025 [Rhizobium sp. Root482]